MLARHRQSLILQAVRSDGSARVSDLTQQLGVSDMTVRRDLEALARDGLIEKVRRRSGPARNTYQQSRARL